jgi:transcriptional regulator with XRE-family HTH domain
MRTVTRRVSRHPTTIFAANLKTARRDSGLTQRQLADVIGVDAITVSRWERGKSKPEDQHLMRLLDHFDRDLASFYTEAAA